MIANNTYTLNAGGRGGGGGGGHGVLPSVTSNRLYYRHQTYTE